MRVKKLVLGFVIPIVILVLWYTATTFMNVPTTILPKIRNVIVTAVDMSKTGQLPVDLGISIGRVVKGFLVSAIVGVVLGSAMGMSETAKRTVTSDNYYHSADSNDSMDSTYYFVGRNWGSI